MSEASPGVFDENRIRRLVELMKEHNLREIDLREGEQGIRLCRGGAEVAPPVYAPAPAAPVAAPAASAAAPTADAANIVLIKSPMVGTYYSRPNPKSEPFVKVGDHIEASTTICVIEAMKVFNEIPAEIRGTVVAILVENEESVDFGKPLFKVDTSK
jgi:acetyl-CoA carboxylase biotin carboxyl carrier protein